MMKEYKQEIILNKNARGCYILDTIKGCGTCLKTNKKGCYGECYAKNIADRYGFDFSKSVKRSFQEDNRQMYLFGLKDVRHLDEIIRQIKSATMPFIRIGEMGDPSEDWMHTISICEQIACAGKPIVIITKHWKTIPDESLERLKKLDLCINTSISALDQDGQIHHRLSQFYRLKDYCKSVLRIVSCDFNEKNNEGSSRSLVQKELFKHKPNIDTVFRCHKDNPLLTGGVINVSKEFFLNDNVLASMYNKKTFFGMCKDCPDMCGVNCA